MVSRSTRSGSLEALNDVDLRNVTSGYLEKMYRMTITYHLLSNVLWSKLISENGLAGNGRSP